MTVSKPFTEREESALISGQKHGGRSFFYDKFNKKKGEAHKNG